MLLKALHHNLDLLKAHFSPFRSEILVEIEALLNDVFIIAVKAFLASLALILILIICWSFFTLQCCR